MKTQIIALTLLLSTSSFANKMLIRDAKGNPVRTVQKVKLKEVDKVKLGIKLSEIIESEHEARCEKIKEAIIDKISKTNGSLQVIDETELADKKIVIEVQDNDDDKVKLVKMKPVLEKCDFSSDLK